MVRLVFVSSDGTPWHWDCAPADAGFICSLVDDRFIKIWFLRGAK